MALNSKKNSIKPIAATLIIMGFLLVLENYNIVNGVHKLWPIFPLIIGIGFWMLFFNYKKKEIPLIGIGTFLICISFLFVYCNFTSWKEMSHLWPLFLTFIGLSFLSIYIYHKKRMFIYLSSFFIVTGIVLFLIFSISAKLWPISVILLGFSLLLMPIEKNK